MQKFVLLLVAVLALLSNVSAMVRGLPQFRPAIALREPQSI